jgi:UDP-N-acetylglucosamine/UDP-N-acetylgalactosamine diphosphorylase
MLLCAAPGGTPQIQWYIMTSPFTDVATRKFFETNRYFGLEPNQVRTVTGF